MSLIRGAYGSYPCPRCLVHKDQQADLYATFDLRTTEQSREVYEKACKLNAKGREQHLKAVGLRNVKVQFRPCFITDTNSKQNTFWDIKYCDPYQALSFDHMHSNSHGLGGKHLWPEVQLHVTRLGRSALVTVDNQYATAFYLYLHRRKLIYSAECRRSQDGGILITSTL